MQRTVIVNRNFVAQQRLNAHLAASPVQLSKLIQLAECFHTPRLMALLDNTKSLQYVSVENYDAIGVANGQGERTGLVQKRNKRNERKGASG